MQRPLSMVLAVLAIALPLAARAVSSDTDEMRAEAEKRTAAANRAASLRPFVVVDAHVVLVTDTDSARRAAAQATARQTHAQYLSDVLRAGAGFRPTPIRLIDTDSARQAAAQEFRQQRLLADYVEYVGTRADPARK